MSETADGDEFHQRVVGALVEDDKPHCKREQREDQDRAIHCQT